MLLLAGLHRSGTSPLDGLLREYLDASGFRQTGVPEDEGQFLRSAYLAPPARAEKLRREWRRHRDLFRAIAILMEMFPLNPNRLRFLRVLFPGTRFVSILCYPLAVAYVTRGWARNTLVLLVRRWPDSPASSG